MSASSIVLIPIVLLGVVTALCFVGCVLNTHGNTTAPVQDAIRNTQGVIAYWPLNDPLTAPPAVPTAADLVGNFTGTYTSGPMVPYDPMNQSAAASGTFAVFQQGIVPGDTTNGFANTCANFDGGFVLIPFQAIQPPFTIEAWVFPQWTFDANAPAIRNVVECAVPPNGQGYALFASTDNFWAAAVGTASGIMQTQPAAASQKIAPNTPFFLALTYDGTTLNLWVNPLDATTPPYAVADAPGFQPAPAMIPLLIGTGRPDLFVSQQQTLNPFSGKIQDVAFYNQVLNLATISAHFIVGAG